MNYFNNFQKCSFFCCCFCLFLFSRFLFFFFSLFFPSLLQFSFTCSRFSLFLLLLFLYISFSRSLFFHFKFFCYFLKFSHYLFLSLALERTAWTHAHISPASNCNINSNSDYIESKSRSYYTNIRSSSKWKSSSHSSSRRFSSPPLEYKDVSFTFCYFACWFWLSPWSSSPSS